MNSLQASSMEVILSHQEYRQLIGEKDRLTARNEELVRQSRAQVERYQALLNEFTKIKEESLELKMQIKDISKQSLRINRFHLVREDQLKGEIVKKEQEIAAAQREVKDKVPQLEQEVVKLKQDLDKKEQRIQQFSQVEAEWKAKLAQDARTHLESIAKLKEENTGIVQELKSKLDRLRKEGETEKAKLKKELQAEKFNSLQLQRKLQNKERQLQAQKAMINTTAFKKIKNSLIQQQKKSKELMRINEDLTISLARSQASYEKIEHQLRGIEEQRNRYKIETDRYSNTWSEMRNKILHSPNVSISMSEGVANECSELRDTLNFIGPASLELLFTTISSINSSSCSKRKAQYQELQEKCQSLEKEKQALTEQLQEMKDIVQRDNQSTSVIQSNANSTMMILDKSFVETLREKDSLLISQKEELMSEKAKAEVIRQKYNNLKIKLAQREAQVQKMKQQRNKFEESLKSLCKIG